MRSLTHTLERFPYLPPLLSCFLLTFALPPFGFWPFALVALVPLYLFIFYTKSLRRIGVGVFLFWLCLELYVWLPMLLTFHWFPELPSFVTLAQWTSAAVILGLVFFGSAALFFFAYSRRSVTTSMERVLFFSTFALVEWVMHKLLLGFYFGSLAHAGGNVPLLYPVASMGGMLLVSFLILFFNGALAEVLRNVWHSDKIRIPIMLPFAIFVLIVGGAHFYNRASTSGEAGSMAVAIIQDQERDPERAYGVVENDSFSFPALAKHIHDAAAREPDIIIYPFSPVGGVFQDAKAAEGLDLAPYVVPLDYDTFGKWLQTHVPKDILFVTWSITLSDLRYFSEFTFWQNGEIVGTYKKRQPVPFFDYTPPWSAELGFFSTPYDLSAGGAQTPVMVRDGVAIGGLVCSEVFSTKITQQNSVPADILLSIGSEIMFAVPYLSEYNLMNAQLRAAETGRPVIRAGKFGPSAFIDAEGNVISKMGWVESDILFGNISLTAQNKTTPYSMFGDVPMLLLLTGYLAYVGTRRFSGKNNAQEKI